jgi:ABC-type Fe3+-citrate transport system substrate-binding protein
MTQLLIQALDAVQKLPPAAQDSIAAMILQELADEEQWSAAFARSQPQLERIANKVRGDIAAGRVREQGIDQL